VALFIKKHSGEERALITQESSIPFSFFFFPDEQAPILIYGFELIDFFAILLLVNGNIKTILLIKKKKYKNYTD
jgi:hypothetical protein